MAKKEIVHPWQQIEQQAFHAFREWPLWLVLRQRELATQLSDNTPSNPQKMRPPSATNAGSTTQQPKRN